MSTAGSERKFSLEQLFEPLDGESFSGERSFQRAVIDAFNSRLSEFPPRYSYLDAIAWAVRQRWLVVDGARITVALPVEADTDAPPLALAA